MLGQVRDGEDSSMDEVDPRRSTSGLPAPGWYPDPEHAGSIRWWDGNTWASPASPQAEALETRPPYRSMRLPTRITLGAFVAYGIVGVVAVASGADRIAALAGLEDGTAGISRAEFSDRWFVAIGILQLVVLAAAAAAFLAFFHRAYKNLRALGYSTNHTTGWAIGGWFVPILGLVRPKQIANEIWQKSGPSPEEKPPRLLSWWWAAFIIQIVAAQIAFRNAAPADGDLDALNTEASIYLLSDFLDLAALVLVIVVTLRLSRRQENYAASLDHDIPRRQESSSTAARADRSATVVPLVALAVGILVAAPLALASQRSDDREGPVARATGDDPGVETVDETSAGAIDSACASFRTLPIATG